MEGEKDSRLLFVIATYVSLVNIVYIYIYNIFLYLIGREGRNAVYVSRKIKLIIEI